MTELSIFYFWRSPLKWRVEPISTELTTTRIELARDFHPVLSLSCVAEGSLRNGAFLKAYRENEGGLPGIAKKGLQAMPVHCWPKHRIMGLQLKPALNPRHFFQF